MSSVLETFFIMFDSDATGVEKGAKTAETATDNLQKKIDQTDKSSTQLGSSFSNMARQAAGAIGALVSVGAILHGVFTTAEMVDNLSDVSEALDVNIEDLAAWGDAVQKAGGSAAGFQGTLSQLTASMAQLDTTGKSRVQPFFKELGISMLDAHGKARPVMDLLPEIAGAFEHLSKAEALGLGQKLGLDQGTIMLLQKGRREVEEIIKRQKELGIITQHDAEIAKKFNDAIDDTRHVFRGLYIQLGSFVLPGLTWLLEKIQDVIFYFRQSENASDALAVSFGILATAIAGKLVASIRALGLSLLLNPFALWTAGIAALGFVIFAVTEDILAFNRGAQSFIGTIVDKFPIVGKVFSFIKQLILEMINVVGEAIASVDKFFDLFRDDKKYSGDMKITQEAIQKGQFAIASASSNPLSAASSNSISNSTAFKRNTTVSIGEVKIETQATEADGIAGAIGDSLNTQIRQATSNADDGVAM
jgi:hypothetical protein